MGEIEGENVASMAPGNGFGGFQTANVVECIGLVVGVLLWVWFPWN